MKLLKRICVCFITVLILSCSAEERIMRWSYTNEWVYIDETRYQVYKTSTGRRYILVIDSDKLKIKRKYIKNEIKRT